MDLVYLESGHACVLKEQIGDKFIVNRVIEYNYSEECGEYVEPIDIIVDKIFDKAPTQKLDSEIKNLQIQKEELEEKIYLLTRDKQLLESELRQMTKTQISMNKFIVNKNEFLNAKQIVFFLEEIPLPKILGPISKDIFKLEFTVFFNKEEEGARFYNIGREDRWGEAVDRKYGFLFDPTQEQVNEIIVKRLNEKKFSPYYLQEVDNKYLNEELLKAKQDYILESRTKKKKDLEDSLKKIQLQLNELDNVQT